MQKKPEYLIPLISDIVLKDWAEVEKEAAARQDKEEQEAEQGTENTARSSMAVGAVVIGGKRAAEKYREGSTQKKIRLMNQKLKKRVKIQTRRLKRSCRYYHYCLSHPFSTEMPLWAHLEHCLAMKLARSTSKVDSETHTAGSEASKARIRSINKENDELEETFGRTSNWAEWWWQCVVDDLEALTGA